MKKVNLPGSEVTINEALQNYTAKMKEARAMYLVPRSTDARNERRIERALFYFRESVEMGKMSLDEMTLYDLDKNIVTQFIKYLTEAQKFNPISNNQYVAILSHIWEWCQNTYGIESRNPFKGKGIVRIQYEAKILTRAELIDLVKFSMDSENKKLGKIVVEAILFLLFAGVRMSEALMIRWRDIQTSEKDGAKYFTYSFPNPKRIRNQENLVVVLSKEMECLLDHLARERKGENDFVLAPELENRNDLRKNIEKSFKEYYIKNGICPVLAPRNLRMTYAYNLLNRDSHSTELTPKTQHGNSDEGKSSAGKYILKDFLVFGTETISEVLQILNRKQK